MRAYARASEAAAAAKLALRLAAIRTVRVMTVRAMGMTLLALGPALSLGFAIDLRAIRRPGIAALLRMVIAALSSMILGARVTLLAVVAISALLAVVAAIRLGRRTVCAMRLLRIFRRGLEALERFGRGSEIRGQGSGR